MTGFEPFPGAPVNPTEWLVSRLRETPPSVERMGAFRAETLPVSYQAVGLRLSEIGRAFRPDIAIHFGLAQACKGFRLERFARNRFVASHADNLGFVPASGPICAGPETLASSLPLAAIHGSLEAAGLPVEWSDDAGGYLCNTVFTLSLARAVDDFHPTMSGFVHVPSLTPSSSVGFGDDLFLAGVDLVIWNCVAAFLAAK
nr:hypothetical protein [Mesorhizobium shangrilense]